MIRLLHLIPSQADFPTRHTVEQLSQNLGDEFFSTCKTLGRHGDFRNVLCAIPALRHDDHQIIHAWGSAPLAAAGLAGAKPIIFSPLSERRLPGFRWLQRLCRRSFQVVSPDSMIAERLARHGVPANRCQTILPIVDAKLPAKPDPAFRGALGLDDRDFIILAPGESTLGAAHYIAVWTTSILHVLDPRFRLLIWGRGSLTSSLERLAGRLGQPKLLIVAEKRLGHSIDFEILPTVASAALIPSSDFPAALPLCQCMAAGLPIIHGGAGIASQLFPASAALAVSPASPKAFAQKILELRDDPKLQAELSDSVRAATYSRFSTDRVEQWRILYRQILRIPAKPLQPHRVEDNVLS